jgi:Fe-S-cluster containining protein
MIVETDLKKIKEVVKKKEDENWQFRSFLKGYDIEVEELDSIVHRLFKEVYRQIDCTTCGNCCREISPVLEDEDIERLSRGLGISYGNFKERFLVKDDKNYSEGFIFNKKPCPFLKRNLCSYYELRPEACRSFPHLHKEEFVFRLIGVVENCDVCPIVFNVYEKLKVKLWHVNGVRPSRKTAGKHK